MFRLVFVLVLPVFIFAADVSNIFRIGTATIKKNGDSVDGTLFGYKRHLVESDITYGADINYILVESNNYNIDDTAEAMLHIGSMVIDDLELYGSFGYAMEGSSENGYGWGLGAVYSINETFSATYEYRSFDLDSYKLKSSSFGILINF